jgi:hypothetical protein
MFQRIDKLNMHLDRDRAKKRPSDQVRPRWPKAEKVKQIEEYVGFAGGVARSSRNVEARAAKTEKRALFSPKKLDPPKLRYDAMASEIHSGTYISAYHYNKKYKRAFFTNNDYIIRKI